MDKKQKALKLCISTRQSIGKYKEKNPNATIGEIAAKFRCTYQQARKAINDWETGQLSRPRASKGEKSVKANTITESPDTLLENQFQLALSSMELNKDMPSETRIQLLEKCFSMRKIIQSLRLEKHIKRADAALIGIIIRKFEPDASDDRIIEIYQESHEKYRSSK